MNSTCYVADALLVAALKRGDEPAFDALYSRYFPKLFSLALRMCKSRESAEEIVHDVFMKIWTNRHQLDSERCFQSYLFTITKHQLLNFLRKQQSQSTGVSHRALEAYAANDHAEQEIIFSDYLLFYEKALSQLSEQKQHIFELNRQQGLSYREIAAKMQLSEKTIEFHMSDCLKQLRKYFRLHTDVVIKALAILFTFFG